jgi:hypothetical protein
MNRTGVKFLYVCAVFLALGMQGHKAMASDHDDGETDLKTRNTNLTDLYVFREDWHTGVPADAANLIFIMNTNPRSLPGEQYFFNTTALYQFHVKTVATQSAAYSTGEDYTLTFQFSAPNSSNVQNITVTSMVWATNATTTATTTSGGAAIATTPIGSSSDTTNIFSLSGVTMQMFAGLKEDPFFFDVTQFFKVRQNIVASSPSHPTITEVFKSNTTAVDFTAGYNVNSVVLQVPLTYFGGGTPTLDVWETISIPQ